MIPATGYCPETLSNQGISYISHDFLLLSPGTSLRLKIDWKYFFHEVVTCSCTMKNVMLKSQDPFSVLCQLIVVPCEKIVCLCVIACPTFLCLHLLDGF